VNIINYLFFEFTIIIQSWLILY